MKDFKKEARTLLKEADDAILLLVKDKDAIQGVFRGSTAAFAKIMLSKIDA